jgi:type II secretory ATPase GspE/PulE/Tfp pilus assembly ATPase PilB-like protein
LEGINQIQVHSKIGLTFAHSLRSILRHDPDVVLVGEIRDLETAENAIQASLTGHLVFSTCTPTMPRAPTRGWWTWGSSRSWCPARSRR